MTAAGAGDRDGRLTEVPLAALEAVGAVRREPGLRPDGSGEKRPPLVAFSAADVASSVETDAAMAAAVEPKTGVKSSPCCSANACKGSLRNGPGC